MELDIIKIGNSRGIRIPQSLLKQCGLVDKIQVEVDGSRLILSKPSVRHGWAEAFAAESGEEEPLLPQHSLSSFDEEEWDW